MIISRTKALFHRLFDLLSTLPENVDPKKYRFFVLINFTCLAGMLVHGGYFIPLFFAFGAEDHSKDTYELVKSQFSFEEPRSIEVKGKGLMETYLLKPLL